MLSSGATLPTDANVDLHHHDRTCQNSQIHDFREALPG